MGHGQLVLGTDKTAQIQLLGELSVVAQGVRRDLPRSRKTRGLLIFLALEDRKHRREDLCRLFFELPNDPRAALRWSLSKLRPLFGAEDDPTLVTDRETVMLDRERVDIDILQIRNALTGKPEDFSLNELQDFESRLSAGLPADLEDAGGIEFHLWLSSEREAVRVLHRRVLDEWAERESLGPVERLRVAGKRVALNRFDEQVNLDYLRLTLKQRGLAAARQAFDEMDSLYREENQPNDGLASAWMMLADRSSSASSSSTPVTPLIDLVEEHPTSPNDSRAVPEKPSVAVLDFRDLGSHLEGGVLANGLAIDLTSRLAQLSNLFVIARASAARVSAMQLTPRDSARRLGVRYLVDGSTQRQDDRVRITITLLEATDESEIWSEHFDRPLENLFEIQDEITNAVAATIEPAIERAEMQRSLIKSPESLSAWENYHRGLWHCFRFTAADSERAQHWFKQALDQDPSFSRAHAGRSFAHYSRAFLNAVPDVDHEIHRALEAASASVGLNHRDAMGHWAQGRALFLSREHDEALASIDQSLSINPNYAQGHYARGFIGIHAGIDEPSISSLDFAQRLSPYDPLLFAMKSSRGISLAIQGRYAEAAPWAIRATHEPNAHFHIYAIAAAVLELAGRSEDARNNASWVLRREPNYTVEVFRRSFPHKDEPRREEMLNALERAGIPRTC